MLLNDYLRNDDITHLPENNSNIFKIKSSFNGMSYMRRAEPVLESSLQYASMWEHWARKV